MVGAESYTEANSVLPLNTRRVAEGKRFLENRWL